MRISEADFEFLVQQLPDKRAPGPDGPPFDQTIQTASDDTLMKYLCQSHAVLKFTMDGQQYFQIECLAPGKQLAIASQ